MILLTGGTKKRQQRDIEAAASMWRDYKMSKRRCDPAFADALLREGSRRC